MTAEVTDAQVLGISQDAWQEQADAAWNSLSQEHKDAWVKAWAPKEKTFAVAGNDGWVNYEVNIAGDVKPLSVGTVAPTSKIRLRNAIVSQPTSREFTPTQTATFTGGVLGVPTAAATIWAQLPLGQGIAIPTAVAVVTAAAAFFGTTVRQARQRSIAVVIDGDEELGPACRALHCCTQIRQMSTRYKSEMAKAAAEAGIDARPLPELDEALSQARQALWAITAREEVEPEQVAEALPELLESLKTAIDISWQEFHAEHERTWQEQLENRKASGPLRHKDSATPLRDLAQDIKDRAVARQQARLEIEKINRNETGT